MQLNFHKMHSLGNDFVVLDGVTRHMALPPEQIRTLGDRNRGVGFDQLLIIEPPTTPDADFYFRIYNADGSEAQQCGNGTRAVALLVSRLGLSAKAKLTWQSLAGEFTTHLKDIEQIETTMTVPVLDLASIPFNQAEAREANQTSSLAQFELDSAVGTFVTTPVSMGNPHGVIFVDDVKNTDVEQIGSTLTTHPAFPERANIGFCQVVDEHFVRLRVYERGTGETQACGSGACAAVVAATGLGLVQGRVKVSLPGGKLKIHWPGDNSRVTMSGDAHLVYSGEIALSAQTTAQEHAAQDNGHKASNGS